MLRNLRLQSQLPSFTILAWRSHEICQSISFSRSREIVHDSGFVFYSALFRIPDNHRLALVDLEFLPLFGECVVKCQNTPQRDGQLAPVGQIDMHVLVTEADRLDAGFLWKRIIRDR